MSFMVAKRVMAGLAGLAITCGLLSAAANPGQVAVDPADVQRLDQGLRDSDVEARRAAAKAVYSSAKGVQRVLLPRMSEMLGSEKDGQVRLFLFDVLTDLGTDAEPAAPALLDTLRTKYGGQEKEELHQDYRAALALASIGKPSVAGLHELLTDSEVRLNVRAEAIMALGRIGKDAEAAIPELVTFLGDKSDRLRDEAIIALGSIGEPALAALSDAAQSAATRVRSGAIEAIGRTRAEDRAAVSSVIAAADDLSPQVRVVAVTSLHRMGASDDKLQPILSRLLKDEDQEVARGAIAVLLERQTLLRAAMPELKRIVGLGDASRARLAAFALSQCGEESIPLLLEALGQPASPIDLIAESMVVLGRSAVPRLEDALDDENPRVRRGAALALGSIRPLSAETPQKMAAGLGDPDPDVRGAFLTALGAVGPRARAVVPEIRRLLDDPDAATRKQAVEVLFLCSARDDQLLEDLVSRITDQDEGVQVVALEQLRALGQLSRKALPEVSGRLESSNAEVRRSAAALIASHGPGSAQAVPSLVRLLESPSPETWVLAIETLARIGRPAQGAFDRLESLLESEHVEVRQAVLQALGSLGLEAESVRPSLAKGLRDTEASVRQTAMQSVRQLGPQGVLLVPDLIRLAENPEEVRSVERALRRFERSGPDIRSIPELIELLGNEKEAVQLLAIRFLALGGLRSSQAIDGLKRLREHPSEAIRKQAKEALEKIEQTEEGAETPGNESR